MSAFGHARAQHLNECEIFFRHRVADRVGDIDRRCAGVDCRFNAAAEKIMFSAGGVLCGPFDVIRMAARTRDLGDHHLVDLVRLLLELVFHVHGRR